MKILIGNDGPMAHMYERLSWTKSLKFSGYDAFFWNYKQKSIYDAFDESNPDIAFLQGYNLNKTFIDCIKERPNLKVLLRVSDWSDWNDKLDRTKYPVLKASQEEIKLVQEIQALSNPIILHTHHHPDWVEQTHSTWIKNGFTVLGLMNCADVFSYCNGIYNNNLASDLCFIGGYWPYKAQKLDKWLLPLCETSEINLKIFGNQAWPTYNYCGMIPEEMTRHVLKSAKICPNVSEPHSTDFGYDIISRSFNLLSNKCFCISDEVEGLVKLFPNSIIFCQSPKDFHDAIQYYIQHPDEKEPYIQQGYQDIKEHTAFDRLILVFNYFGLDTSQLTLHKKRFFTELEKHTLQ